MLKKLKMKLKKASNANSVIDVQGQSVKGVGRTSLDGLVNIDLTYGNGRYYLKDSNKNIYLYDLKIKLTNMIYTIILADLTINKY